MGIQTSGGGDGGGGGDPRPGGGSDREGRTTATARGGGGDPGGGSEAPPPGRGRTDPGDPDYKGLSRGTTAHLLRVRTKKRPAADLFCTRDRCVAKILANAFGEYMRGGSKKRQTARLIKDRPRPVSSFG